MEGEIKQRWQMLCEQATVEQNPETLLKLIQEIAALLDEKHQRLHATRIVKLPNVELDGHAA